VQDTEMFPDAKVELKDVQFMTAADKRRVLKQWREFLASDCARGLFTRDLYKHLINHCSFIAHYDWAGFYGTYFEEPQDTIRFLTQFDDSNGIPKSIEYGMTGWYTDPDYHDINAEMCRIARPHIPRIVGKCRDAQKERDMLRARLLMRKHGITELQG